MKACTLCGEVKELTEFYAHAQKKATGGLQARCKTCWGAATSAYQKANKAALNAKNNERRARNSEVRNKQLREYYAASSSTQERLATWRKANPDKVKAYNKVWADANKDLINAYAAKRRAYTRQALPLWADFDKINALYRQAKLLRDIGLDVHVDHIIPLKNDTVCGLHVHDNLRVILASENLSKSNKFVACA